MKYADFKVLIEGHHGTAKDFNQLFYVGRFVNAVPEQKDVTAGVCRALSVAYLVKNHDKTVANQPDAAADFPPDMTRDLLANKFFAAFDTGRKIPTFPFMGLSQEQKNRNKERFRWIAQAQIANRWPRQPETVDEGNQFDQNSVQGTMNMISGNPMRFQGKSSVSFPREEASTTQFPDRQGFWILSVTMNTGAHALALCFRDKIGSEKAKFFDPNLGQATFGSYENCRNFLNAFLKEQYIGITYVQEYA